MLNLDRYVPKESSVNAILLTGANLHEAAKLCGGEVGPRHGAVDLDSAYDTVLRIPTLHGSPDQAIPGDYLVRDENGRFSAWNRSAFEQKYKRIGLRQDGIQLPPNATRGGSTTTRGHLDMSGEAWTHL